MINCGLATYTLRVWERENSQTRLTIDSFSGDHDLLQVIKEYLKDRQGLSYKDDKGQRILRVDQINLIDRSLSGIIEKGEYGTEEPLINVDTSTVEHVKQIDEAPMFPHYFLIVIPNNAEIGLVILERSGRRGIKGNLSDDLSNYFSSRFEDHQIAMQQIMPKQLLDMFIKRGKIAEIRFVKFSIPPDFINEFYSGHFEEELTAQLIIKGRGLDKMKEKFQGFFQRNNRVNLNEFIEIQGSNFEDIKIDFVVDGKHRLISLMHPFSRGAIWDITDNRELKFGLKGHPTFDSIDALAKEYAEVILRGMRVEI